MRRHWSTALFLSTSIFLQSYAATAGDLFRMQMPVQQVIITDPTPPGGGVNNPTDDEADPFTIAPVTDIEPGTSPVSETVSPTGFDLPITVAAADGATVSVDGGAYVPSTTINPTQTFTVQAPASSDFAATTTFEVTLGVATSATWSVTTRDQDVTADAFVIPAVTGAAPNVSTTSDFVTPTGFEGSIPISADNGGQVSVDGGAWAAATTIEAGQGFYVNLTSSASYNAMVSSTVSLGGQSAPFNVSTHLQDTTPDAVAFTALTGQALNSAIPSNTVTVTGFDGSIDVTGTNGVQFSKNAGAYAASTTVVSGDTLALQLTSSASFNTAVSTAVSIGTLNTTWSVSTRTQDLTPDAYTIAAVTGADVSSFAISGPVTPVGYEGAVSVTATNGATISIDGGSFAATQQIAPTQSFRVRLATSALPSTNSSTTVTVGGVSATFTATTIGEQSVTLSSNATNISIQTYFSAGQWTSTQPKRLIIPASITVGSSNTALSALRSGTGWGGTLTLEIAGSVRGAPGAANSGTGGDAVLVEQAGLRIQNTGSIYAGGGGGGKGANGSAGTTTTTTTEGPSYSGSTYWAECCMSSREVMWNGVYKGFTSAVTNSFVGNDGATYTRGGMISPGPGYSYYQVTRTGTTTTATAGGTGGNGGIGQGYLTSATLGQAGTAGGGGTATAGYNGGAGGGFGASGGPGFGGGAAGGLAGYAIRNIGNAVVTGGGAVLGR